MLPSASTSGSYLLHVFSSPKSGEREVFQIPLEQLST